MVNELIIFDSYFTQMAKAVRFNVRCTICKEVFKTTMLKDIQNPSIKIYATGRVTPTTIILEENHGSLRTMDSFFSSSAEDALSSKRRRIELTESFDTEKSTVLCYNPCDTSAFPDSDSQKTNVEIDKYDGSEESSIGEISEETDPAGLEDIRDSREDTTPQGAVYSERICTERHPE